MDNEQLNLIPDLWVVYWRSMSYPHAVDGQGEPVDKRTAEAWVTRMNEEYPDIIHWCEPYESPTPARSE